MENENGDGNRSGGGAPWLALLALLIVCATVVALCWITRTTPQ